MRRIVVDAFWRLAAAPRATSETETRTGGAMLDVYGGPCGDRALRQIEPAGTIGEPKRDHRTADQVLEAAAMQEYQRLDT